MGEAKFKLGDLVDVRCKSDPSRNCDGGVVVQVRHGKFVNSYTRKIRAGFGYIVEGSRELNQRGEEIWLHENCLYPHNEPGYSFESIMERIKTVKPEKAYA